MALTTFQIVVFDICRGREGKSGIRKKAEDFNSVSNLMRAQAGPIGSSSGSKSSDHGGDCYFIHASIPGHISVANLEMGSVFTYFFAEEAIKDLTRDIRLVHFYSDRVIEYREDIPTIL